MLINALCDYYDLKTRKSQSSLPEGYAAQEISFQIRLTEDGEIAAIVDMRDPVEIYLKNGKSKEQLKPKVINLPERSQKTAIFSNLIEHRPLYIFGLNYGKDGFTTDDDKDKAKKSHAAFVKRNLEFFKDLNSPICTAYRRFIEKWKPEEQTENPYLLELGKLYSGSYFSFALYSDPRITPENDECFLRKYIEYLSEQVALTERQGKNVAQCPIMGERLPVARIHDKIKFPGGNTVGCQLVAMKESAYESYGKTQSYNSNISEAAMKKYTAAFNEILDDKNHRVILEDMVIVYFAMKADDFAECDMMAQMFGASAGGDENEAFGEVIKELSGGNAVDYSALGIDEDVTLYFAGFTPNSSRICQKFIVRDSFGKIMENLFKHQRDLSIDGSGGRPVYFNYIFKELVSPKSSKEKVPPPLITDIILAAIKGTNYPTALLHTAIRRVKTDRNEENNSFIRMNSVRAGIIKACLNRKARNSDKEEEITMSLDTSSKNPAYLCGRLFAVLEKLQQDAADSKLNTTIGDTYFSSASSNPASVLPRLMKLAFYHMRKLSDGGVIFYKNLISEITDPLENKFPSTLNLEEQGRFIIGYYHQNRKLWEKKESQSDRKETDKEN